MNRAALTAAEIEQGRANARIGTELVHESESMQVWHLRLAPGEGIPPHRHDRPYFWTILTDGRAVSRYDDGRVATIEYRAGMTGDFPELTPDGGFVHDLLNIGETDLVFVTVEFRSEEQRA